MSSNPFMVLDFSNQLAQQKPLTEIGAGVNQVVTQRRQEAAAAAAQQQYQNALAAFMKDRTPENRMAVMEAGNAIGRFDQVQQQVQAFDSATRQQEVDDVMNLYGPLSTGNTDIALNHLDRQIQAMEGAAAESGAVPEELVELREMRESVANGDTDAILAMLELELANMGEEGTKVLENWTTVGQEGRDSRRHIIEMIELGNSLEYLSEEDRGLAIDNAEFLGGSFAQKIAELGRAISQYEAGGMTFDDVIAVERGLRKEYDDYTEAARNAGAAAQQMAAVVRNMPGNGFVDNALINLFNRVIDPGSVVRTSEAARTEQAQGVFDRAEVLFEKLREGSSLTPESREELLNIVNGLSTVYSQVEETQRERLGNTLDLLWADNDEQRELSETRVFIGSDEVQTGGTNDASTGMARQLIGENAPLQVQAQIEDMNATDLKNRFPSLYQTYVGPTLPPADPTGQKRWTAARWAREQIEAHPNTPVAQNLQQALREIDFMTEEQLNAEFGLDFEQQFQRFYEQTQAPRTTSVGGGATTSGGGGDLEAQLRARLVEQFPNQADTINNATFETLKANNPGTWGDVQKNAGSAEEVGDDDDIIID